MKCEDVDNWIVDMGRDSEMDEALRSEAMAHFRSCPGCAARLADERWLSSALKQLAATPVQVPARIEEALLTAYRARHTKTSDEEVLRRSRQARPAHYWGIAAALLIGLLGVAALRLMYFPGQQTDNVLRSGGTKAAQQMALPEEKPPAPEAAAATSPTLPGTGNAGAAAAEIKPKDSAAPKKPANAEVATDFFALASDSMLASMESGQLVRVTLPRSALDAYGLPFNRELADKPVAAQVLIGQDGVARAIRFLSDPEVRAVPVGFQSKR